MGCDAKLGAEIAAHSFQKFIEHNENPNGEG